MVFTYATESRALASARAARHALAEQLTAWGLAEHCDEVELITSELVTNAIRHGGGVTGVSMRAADHVIRIEVTDAGTGALEVREASATAFSGRGLALVDAMSTDWGVFYLPDGGKTVWSEIHA